MAERKIQVLSVCTFDAGGGAALAAYRIHKGVGVYEIDSQMFVKSKSREEESVCSLKDFVPRGLVYRVFDWCLGKVRNKIQHYRWSQYPKRDNYYKSDMRGTSVHGALQKLSYDILHLHWVNGRFLDLRELRKIDKPIVWTLHDSWPFCGVCHYFLDCEEYQRECGKCPQLGSNDAEDLSHKVWKAKQRIYEGLDLHIVTPSQWLADCARKSGLFKGLDIRVIPNCLDTESFRPMGKDEMEETVKGTENEAVKQVVGKYLSAEGSDAPCILYGAVNALTDKIKGLEYLISALKELDAHGFCANLVVFGVEQSDLPLSFSHISVDFVGFIHDASVMAVLYNLSDITVVPSQSENLSYVCMESLACGTPVVAFDVGGIPDMVEHKKNGYLAKRGDSGDLAHGIEWCLKNNEDKSLSANARDKIKKGCSIDVVARQYVSLYNEIKR